MPFHARSMGYRSGFALLNPDAWIAVRRITSWTVSGIIPPWMRRVPVYYLACGRVSVLLSKVVRVMIKSEAVLVQVGEWKFQRQCGC